MPSTPKTFLPPYSTIDQLPTTDKNLPDSWPLLSLDRSTRIVLACALFPVFCAPTGITTRAVNATANVVNSAIRNFIILIPLFRASIEDKTSNVARPKSELGAIATSQKRTHEDLQPKRCNPK